MNKLNYKELRIGNLVNVSEKPETVTGVLQFGCYFHLLYYPFNLSQIEPIKLTEEWLVKFGFKKLDKYTFVKNGFFIHRRKIGFIFNIGRKKIILNFVHLLQNMYFCTELKEL